MIPFLGPEEWRVRRGDTQFGAGLPEEFWRRRPWAT
jgi:hypothetical protein